ncbi:MAG: DUF2460 domain-containing protein [Parvibaculum sp.]
MMAFHEIRFPVDVAFGSSGGPERRTEIVTLGSGHEERNTPWASSRRKYNAGYGVKSLADLYAVLSFFEARKGRLHGFRWKDRIDYSSTVPGQAVTPLDQVLGTGDDARVDFQLIKTYQSGLEAEVRTITKPVAGTVRISVGGVERVAGIDYVLNATSGMVTFLAGHIPGGGVLVKAGYEFDVPVRFDTDALDINLTAFEAGDIPNVPVIEVQP